MSPTTQTEIKYPKAKGTIRIGEFMMTWDFTEILEERKRRDEEEKRMNYFETKSGKIIMYKLGIF